MKYVDEYRDPELVNVMHEWPSRITFHISRALWDEEEVQSP
jgi:hypothetical protein